MDATQPNVGFFANMVCNGKWLYSEHTHDANRDTRDGIRERTHTVYTPTRWE